MALNIFGISRTIILDILNVFDRPEHATGFLYKIKFDIVYDKIFFLTDLSLSSTNYEFPKSTRHALSVSLNLECARILS